MQCIIDESEYNQIINTRKESDSLLECIKFNGEELFYDRISGTFYYSLIEGNTQAFDPRVKTVSTYKDIQIAFLGSVLTQEMIEKSETVRVLVYTQELYGCYNLVCTTLPLLNINCEEDIGEEYVSMEIILFDNRKGAVNRVVNSSGSIRIRGGNSRSYPKLGYRLQLIAESLGMHERENQISLLGMRQDDDWILYAGYNDQEKIRNVFSSNLWKYSCASENDMCIDAGIEYKYLELFINEEYWGLYALGYPVDKKQLELGKDTSKEALYKVIQWLDEQSVMLTEDGNIVEYEQKGVDEEKEEGWNLLLEYYNNLKLNYADSEELYKWIDIDNIINIYLFINLIQGVDHARNDEIYNIRNSEIFNMYLAMKTDYQGRLKGLYIPWDMDRTWGNPFGDIPYGMTPDYQVVMESGYLGQIISNRDTDVWEKIFDKYWALRNDEWSEEALNSLIDKYETDIFDSGAFIRDMERWPDGNYVDPADKLNRFRWYVNTRLAETDLYYERLEKVCKESIFIRKSAGYKYFNESRFLIEINDKSLLLEPEYIDLLKHLKIDIEKITDDICYIVAVPSKNSVEYFQNLGNVGETLSTNAGVISLEGEPENYMIRLDGFGCYRVSASDSPKVAIMFMDDYGVANLWKPID